MLADPRSRAALALMVAGFGWGTTGLFVRTLGHLGLSAYDLLIVRLIVAGLVIVPILFFDLWKTGRRVAFRPTILLGVSMVFYYLGAITAFLNLQLIVAALIIGSSPLMAWLAPLILERRLPSAPELRKGSGVAFGISGLAILISTRAAGSVIHESAIESLGYVGAFTAAIVTVANARFLKAQGTAQAPRPFEITASTVVVGLILSPLLISNAGRVLEISQMHPWLVFGFGILATAIPGVAIAYASVRLPPQATATVSIQLQVWSGVLAWIILNEAMTFWQILAAILIVVGSWICVAEKNQREEKT